MQVLGNKSLPMPRLLASVGRAEQTLDWSDYGIMRLYDDEEFEAFLRCGAGYSFD
jgi:hypothetical protein